MIMLMYFSEKAFDKAFQLEDGAFKSGELIDHHHHHFPAHLPTATTTTTTTTMTTNINGQQTTTNASNNDNLGRHKKNSLGKSGSLGAPEALSLPSVLGASLKHGNQGEQATGTGRNSNVGQANTGVQNQGK
jgi:hypothetical protein